MLDRVKAKEALDSLINKSRVHLYKPIQIAEILYHIRSGEKIDPLVLEDYRIKSKGWRDEISLPLLGRVCTSSAKFQDDLFNNNAIPPQVLKVLNDENARTGGAVEAYIYKLFTNKHVQLSNALDVCLKATKETFSVKAFIDSFWDEPGLKRSLDKVYEIIVYALFSTLVDYLNLKVEISIDESHMGILSEFGDFSKKVLCIDFANPKFNVSAKLFRVGVTNAADRGLDMYSNWGPVIQIKHLSLDATLAEDIVNSVSSDRIVIVCKDAEKDVIVSLLSQMGWKARIQSIVTEDELVLWYEKALRGKYSIDIGDDLLNCLCEEIENEFPSIDEMPIVLKNRHYEKIKDAFWT